jgi:hypothetical protein
VQHSSPAVRQILGVLLNDVTYHGGSASELIIRVILLVRLTYPNPSHFPDIELEDTFSIAVHFARLDMLDSLYVVPIET